LGKTIKIYQKHFYPAKNLPGIPSLLAHGDLWGNNILFNQKTSQLLALIDWQFAHAGILNLKAIKIKHT
jgi:thiamine kinase-like enzyme